MEPGERFDDLDGTDEKLDETEELNGRKVNITRQNKEK